MHLRATQVDKDRLYKIYYYVLLLLLLNITRVAIKTILFGHLIQTSNVPPDNGRDLILSFIYYIINGTISFKVLQAFFA